MKNSAKNKLKKYYNFKESDFYTEDGIDYTISQDNYMEKAIDVYENLELERKEKYEDL
jgi:ASC-1-like (ASCH) protein